MWIICLLVLSKPSLINNYLVLLISIFIVLSSNVSKAMLYIILYRNHLELNKNKCNLSIYVLSLFCFFCLSYLVYLIILKICARRVYILDNVLFELRKKVKFDHTNKWYIHNAEFNLEHEMHKIL